MVDRKKYDKGQLVQILVLAKECTDEGFMLYGIDQSKDNYLAIFYELIDLFSYPSCNDFLGKKTVVRHGDLATVLSYKGYPNQFKNSPVWDCYDVYEILINGDICHAFKHNLEPVMIGQDLCPRTPEEPCTVAK